MDIKQISKRIGKGIETHLVDTAVLNAVANPIFSALEVTAYGMTDDVSLNARLFAGAVGYLGAASLFSKGRELSRYIFNIKQDTKEKVQKVHDRRYMAAFNAVFAPIMYSISGEENQWKILFGTLGAVGVGIAFGGFFGYSIDAFRDLTGLEECRRKSYPKKIKNLKPSLKMGLAALLVSGSLAINAGIYAVTPNKFGSTDEYKQTISAKEGIEDRVDSADIDYENSISNIDI